MARIGIITALVLILALGTIAWGQTTDPAKVAELSARYQAGVALYQQGKFDDALADFQTNLKEEPKAKGSLWYAGLIELEKNQPETALTYLLPLQTLDPKNFHVLILLIQANQALNRDIRVGQYREQLLSLRTGTVPGLTDTVCYTREKISQKAGPSNAGPIEFNEFFDFRQPPYIAWEACQFSPTDGHLLRHLLLAYNPDQTATLRQKDPSQSNAQVFLFGENVIKDQAIQQFNLYRQETAQPDYATFRKWALDALQNPPKPLLIQPMTTPAPAPTPAKP